MDFLEHLQEQLSLQLEKAKNKLGLSCAKLKLSQPNQLKLELDWAGLSLATKNISSYKEYLQK